MLDSHAHYDDARFDGDRDALLTALFAEKTVTHIVNAATDLPSARVCEALSERYDGMYHTVGVHPQEASGAPAEYIDVLRRLAQHPKAVAVGEIGLDYHYDDVPRDVQRRVFARQLDLACELGLPAVIHDREAHKDCIDEVMARPALQCVFHSFSGSEESARVLARRGVYMAFNGVVTFKNAEKTRRAAKAVPDELLLVETDCPYLAPHPHRGKRNDSALMRLTIAALAEQRGQTPEYIERITTENALWLFPKILR